MNTTRLRWAGLAMVAVAGGAALVVGPAAGSGPDLEVSKAIPADDGPTETLLPVSSGDEPAVFSNRVSLLQDGQVTTDLGPGEITIWNDPRGICYRAEFPDLQTTGCVDDATLRSGFSYSASQGPLGVTYLFGLVPDEVSLIEISDETIPVRSNLWYYEPTEGQDLAFRAVTADGIATRKLGD